MMNVKQRMGVAARRVGYFNKISLVSSLVVSGIALSSAFATKADAAVLIAAQQTGGNVVFSYSGSLNTTGLGLNVFPLPDSQHRIIPATGVLNNFSSPYLRSRNGVLSGPTSFGTGAQTNANSYTGDSFSLNPTGGSVVLPSGYTSGSALSGSVTFDSTTLAGLGVTPGTYVWTLTNGDTITVTTSAIVPEPLTILGSIAGLAFLGKTASVRKRKKLAK